MRGSSIQGFCLHEVCIVFNSEYSIPLNGGGLELDLQTSPHFITLATLLFVLAERKILGRLQPQVLFF